MLEAAQSKLIKAAQPSSMPKLKINGTEIEVAPGTSILQASEMLGYEVPRFCYHDKLSVPANCRMCLVEVKGAPEPVASCAMACGESMEVTTDSPVVKKARNGVMDWAYRDGVGAIQDAGFAGARLVDAYGEPSMALFKPGTVRSATTGETLFSDTGKPSIFGAAAATAGEQPNIPYWLKF